MTFANIRTLPLLLTVLFLAACSGGASTTANQEPIPVASCDPADPSTFDECGTVLIGFTDADGDFLNYTINVVRLMLETADGRTVVRRDARGLRLVVPRSTAGQSTVEPHGLALLQHRGVGRGADEGAAGVPAQDHSERLYGHGGRWCA